jgi:hypothetical protein
MGYSQNQAQRQSETFFRYYQNYAQKQLEQLQNMFIEMYKLLIHSNSKVPKFQITIRVMSTDCWVYQILNASKLLLWQLVPLVFGPNSQFASNKVHTLLQ